MKKLILCCVTCGVAFCLQAKPVKHTPKDSPTPTPTPQVSPSPTTTPPASPAPTPNLPSGALIKPLPNYTAWTVTTTSLPPASPTPEATPSKKKKKTPPAIAPEPKPVKTITGQKVLPVVHVSTTTDNGKEECWSDGKTMVTTNTAWKVPLFATGAPEEFPRPTWISRKNIKEIRKQGDREFWVFRDRIFPGGEVITKDMLLPGENPEDLKVDAVAVIDAQTRLPDNVQIGGETTTYKFERMPLGVPLEIPFEIRKAIADREFDSTYRPPDTSQPGQSPPSAPRP